MNGDCIVAPSVINTSKKYVEEIPLETSLKSFSVFEGLPYEEKVPSLAEHLQGLYSRGFAMGNTFAPAVHSRHGHMIGVVGVFQDVLSKLASSNHRVHKGFALKGYMTATDVLAQCWNMDLMGDHTQMISAHTLQHFPFGHTAEESIATPRKAYISDSDVWRSDRIRSASVEAINFAKEKGLYQQFVTVLKRFIEAIPNANFQVQHIRDSEDSTERILVTVTGANLGFKDFRAIRSSVFGYDQIKDVIVFTQ